MIGIQNTNKAKTTYRAKLIVANDNYAEARLAA
jgi:hypothetical protein